MLHSFRLHFGFFLMYVVYCHSFEWWFGHRDRSFWRDAMPVCLPPSVWGLPKGAWGGEANSVACPAQGLLMGLTPPGVKGTTQQLVFPRLPRVATLWFHSQQVCRGLSSIGQSLTGQLILDLPPCCANILVIQSVKAVAFPLYKIACLCSLFLTSTPPVLLLYPGPTHTQIVYL